MNCEEIILNLFENKGTFCKNAEIIMVGVYDQTSLIAGCFLVIHNNYKDAVLVCFFEALPNYQLAVDLIIKYARELGVLNNCKKIVIGLNTHINAGAGILVEEFNTNSYGNNYNPPYYVNYFKNFKANIHTMTSYKGNVEDFSVKTIEKIVGKVYKRFTFREISTENFRSDMALYTRLANQAFAEHKFYYQRKEEEDYELYEPMLTTLKSENILFAERDGEIVGCLMWYPNYYEECTRSFKIIEIGVLPSYRKSGVLLGLFNECYKRTNGKFNYMESGWIFDDNFLSKSITNRWMKKVHKRFNVYELQIQNA
ncbi:GNAT family N-acetyltransferase [Clostridium algoriphilum]|uniref:GNAT family N-acetyltransferase n=1 Tax=Clostridium algoriphilum TaxID=198347 RepID=UPI001CF2E729|nr:GNAT family N-acetyltransferase [Clostridium algoriphilum]MCB2296076.1 GNAT family N-acetyltransferase [Clostridium algoriphilum]